MTDEHPIERRETGRPWARDGEVGDRAPALNGPLAPNGRRFVIGVELDDGTWTVVRGGPFAGDATWDTEYHWVGPDMAPTLIGTDHTFTLRGVQSYEVVTNRPDLRSE